MTLNRRTTAEFIGTFWLVFGGCGSAIFTAGFPHTGIGFLGVALAFGLTVLTMAFAFGHVSGAHFNPAVTFGFWAARRFPAREVLPYMAAQVVGAIVASVFLLLIAKGQAGFSVNAGFAANGYGIHSVGGYALPACILGELVLTFMFVLVCLSVTEKTASPAFAPIAIGLALTIVHLVGIPLTNTSVNPARSTGPALIVGGWALRQLWLFWVAPLVAGALAGIFHRGLAGERAGAPVERAPTGPELTPA